MAIWQRALVQLELAHEKPVNLGMRGSHPEDDKSVRHNSLAPLPPKYAVGSLVQFKNSKRNQRWKLAGKVALVIQAEAGGNYKVQYDGSEDRYNPFYAQRDLEMIS